VSIRNTHLQAGWVAHSKPFHFTVPKRVPIGDACVDFLCLHPRHRPRIGATKIEDYIAQKSDAHLTGSRIIMLLGSRGRQVSCCRRIWRAGAKVYAHGESIAKREQDRRHRLRGK
jgi:hypothetical protein